MSGKNVLFLAAVLAALGLAFWFTQGSAERAKVAEESSKKLFTFKPAELASLTITQKEGKPSTAKQQNGEWAIVAPYAVKADTLRLKRVAETLANAVSDRTLDVSESSYSEYGLDKPVLKVDFEAAGKTHAIEFGGIAPTQDHRYARLDQGPVLLVRAESFQELNLSLQDLRHRAMIDGGASGIDRFEFTWIGTGAEGKETESIPVCVERREDGRWYMTKPMEGAAEQGIVKNFAAMLAQMPGRDYVDAPETLADYGLQPPKARIVAWAGPKAPAQTLYVGGLAKTGEKDGIYVKRGDAPAVFVVEPGFAQLLPQKPDAYLARTLLTYSAADIKTLHYRAGSNDIVLENDAKQGWRMTQPAADKTDQEAASAFIANLKNLTVQQFLGPTVDPSGLEPRTLTMDITLKDGKTIAVTVGKALETGGYYAVQDTGMGANVPAGQVEALLVDSFFFRDKLIFDISKGNISRLAVTLDGVKYVFERTGKDWSIREPAQKRWDSPSDMHALLSAIGIVAAQGAEPADADRARCGVDAPVLVIEATAEATNRVEQDTVFGPLAVGAPSESDSQQRYATVAGRPEIYRIPQAIVDAVRESLKGVREAQ